MQRKPAMNKVVAHKPAVTEAVDILIQAVCCSTNACKRTTSSRPPLYVSAAAWLCLLGLICYADDNMLFADDDIHVRHVGVFCTEWH